MYYYFSARFCAVIKIDGVYYGQIDQKLKKINLSHNAFVEVCPLELSQFPFSFILNQRFLSCPPNGVSVVNLKGGYLIEFNFLGDNSPFSILSQEKFNHAIVTVFKENGLKVSIETPNDFFAETLPFYAQNAKITPFCLNNGHLIAIAFSSNNETLLNCYLLENQIKKVFSKMVCDFSLENGFKTTEKFLDIAKHKLTCFWQLDGEKLIKSQTVLEKEENFSINCLPSHLIGYAFLEEFGLGGEVGEFLDDNVKENQDYLNKYFGEFLGVMPPPDFRSYDEIGLIYKESENLYKVEYFCFEIRDKKICNIKKAE